ncbi:MAG TPA: hypothetical protein VE242_15360 [Chthoniobacterales bacterium]|nr:hypothetical protein [Chthoniobacterales bacterium]
MKSRGEFPGIPTVDFLLGLVVVFVVLFQLSLVVANDEAAKAKEDHLKNASLYLIKMSWPGESDDDVDLYVSDPAHHLVFFKAMQSGLMSLDRDDTGRGSNTVILPDGRKVMSAWNEERVTIRGIVEGEYIVNVHMYRKSSNPPTKVEVSLYKTDSSEDIMVHQKVVTLSAERQEETAFRFTLTKDGNVVDINELPKSFVGHNDT